MPNEPEPGNTPSESFTCAALPAQTGEMPAQTLRLQHSATMASQAAAGDLDPQLPPRAGSFSGTPTPAGPGSGEKKKIGMLKAMLSKKEVCSRILSLRTCWCTQYECASLVYTSSDIWDGNFCVYILMIASPNRLMFFSIHKYVYHTCTSFTPSCLQSNYSCLTFPYTLVVCPTDS